MKIAFASAAAVAALLVAGAASAAEITYYDPAESGFVTRTVNPAPAPLVVAPAPGETVSVFDPADSEFKQVPAQSSQVVITTHSPAPRVPSNNSGWDPADN